MTTKLNERTLRHVDEGLLTVKSFNYLSEDTRKTILKCLSTFPITCSEKARGEMQTITEANQELRQIPEEPHVQTPMRMEEARYKLENDPNKFHVFLKKIITVALPIIGIYIFSIFYKQIKITKITLSILTVVFFMLESLFTTTNSVGVWKPSPNQKIREVELFKQCVNWSNKNGQIVINILKERIGSIDAILNNNQNPTPFFSCVQTAESHQKKEIDKALQGLENFVEYYIQFISNI